MPAWVRTILLTGPLEETERAVKGHLEHLRVLRRDGKLRSAGRIGRGEGFMEVFDAKDLYEAEVIARSSPLVAGGLGAWSIREWEGIDL